MKTEVKIEDVKEYLEKFGVTKSHEKLQEESNKDEEEKKQKRSIWVQYWFGRWQSYDELLSKIFLKDEERLPLRLLKIEDFLKFVETAINSLNDETYSHERSGRLDSYHDIRYLIVGKDEEREILRLDKETNLCI